MKTFYQKEDFEFSKIFEDNWEVIYKEYTAVQDQMISWIEHELHEDNWEVFGLFSFPDGKEFVSNCALCPVTTQLIKQHISHNGAAGFSRLKANSAIAPHHGHPGKYLRMHLGLDVPAGDVALKVNNDVYHWKNKEVAIFDDRLLHEAWNKTNKDRVVLIVDFIP